MHRPSTVLELQRRELLECEPTLLVYPSPALHVSVAWLLAVEVEYDEPKDAIWARHGQRWQQELAAIAAELQSFTLSYHWLVVTDTSVIALADPVEPVQRLRDQIKARIDLPPQTSNESTIVHTTVARFGGPLRNPSRLLDHCQTTSFAAPMTIDQIEISRELVYPSIATDVVAQLRLAAP